MMRVEFVKALIHNESLETVKHELIKRYEKEFSALKREVENDFKAALLIREGLSDQQNKEAFSMANCFLEDYKKEYKIEDDSSESNEIAKALLEGMEW